MKVTSKLLGLFLLVTIVANVNAQEQELSWTAKRLKEQVDLSNNKAILEAAKTGDVTLLPYLKQLSSRLESRSNSNHAAFYAHVALAKLGDVEAIKQILEEINNESSRIQGNGMYKLKLVGGKVAFRKFYELLDDSRPRENTDCIKMYEEHNAKHPEDQRSPNCDDVIYFSKSVTVLFYLRSMVDDPPTRRFSGAKQEIDLWKAWIKNNGYLMDK